MSNGVMPHKTQHSTQEKRCWPRNVEAFTPKESMFSEGRSNTSKQINPMGDANEVCQQCKWVEKRKKRVLR